MLQPGTSRQMVETGIVEPKVQQQIAVEQILVKTKLFEGIKGKMIELNPRLCTQENNICNLENYHQEISEQEGCNLPEHLIYQSKQ